MNHVFVICAYKDSPYLEQCIRSLLRQTCPSEIYITTSTPSDYITFTAHKYRIPVFVREGESSLKDDWRFAVEVGSRDHDLVTITHQDDVYRRDYVRELGKAYEKYPDMSVFASDYVVLRTEEHEVSDGELYPVGTRVVTGDPVRLVKKILRLPLRIKSLAGLTAVKKSAIMFGNSICCPSCTYNIAKTSRFMFGSDYEFALDWDNLLWLCARSGKFVICEDPLVAYRIHDAASTKKSIDNDRRREEEFEVYKKLWPAPVASLLMQFYKLAWKNYG